MPSLMLECDNVRRYGYLRLTRSPADNKLIGHTLTDNAVMRFLIGKTRIADSEYDALLQTLSNHPAFSRHGVGIEVIQWEEEE